MKLLILAALTAASGAVLAVSHRPQPTPAASRHAIRASCAPRDGIIIVSHCGAHGNGLVPDSAAIGRAVAAARAERAVVYFPPGRYLVDESIRGFDGIALRGADGAYSYSSSGVGSPGMPAVLVASRALGERAILDFRGASNTAISSLGFELGSTKSYAIELGSRHDGTVFPNHEIDRISTHGGEVGLRARNAGLLHIRDSNFSDARYIGVWLDAFCGDSDLDGVYVNGTYLNAPRRPAGPVHDSPEPIGAGIFLGNGSGNTNIRGGKIEWNLKGIVVSDAQGVTINGINFDFNTWGHLIVHGHPGMPQTFPRGVVVNANRFLSGGIHGAQAAILVRVDRAEAIVNITGNSFRMASDRANDFDGSRESPAPRSASVGPVKYCIEIASEGGTAFVNIAGNEMINCAAGSGIGAFGRGVLVQDSGNLENLANSVGGGAMLR